MRTKILAAAVARIDPGCREPLTERLHDRAVRALGLNLLRSGVGLGAREFPAERGHARCQPGAIASSMMRP